MTVETLPARASLSPPAARPAARAGVALCLLAGLLGILIPINQYVEVSAGQVNVSAGDVLLLPLAALLVGRWLRGRSLGYWLFGLWMVNLVAWTLSLSVLTKMIFLREVVKLVACYVYALVGFGLGCHARTTAALVKGMLLAAVPIAALGIFAYFFRSPAFFIQEARVVGTFQDPNAFACYLAMVLPLATTLPLGWMAAPLFLGAGIVSFSRSGIASLASSFALTSVLAGARRYLVVAIISLLVLLALWGSVGGTALGLRFVKYGGTLDERKGLWALASDVSAQHPILGIGKGNWEAVSGSRTLPHNTFLSLMVDTGLIGLALFLLPLAVWLLKGARRRDARPWAIAVLASMVGGVAISFDNFRPFWLALGVLVARLSAPEEEVGAQSPPGASSLPTLWEQESLRPRGLRRGSRWGERG